MSYSSEDLKKWLLIAKEAALVSGSFLAQGVPESKKVENDLGSEIKISADLDSEKVIVDYLRSRNEFPILTEESGFLGTDREDMLNWVVDPLDGSINFLRSIPICCVSIALCQKDVPLLGVIYDFNKKEMFSGIAKEGAWLNDKPISVSDAKEKAKAILFTGTPAKADTGSQAMSFFISKVSSYRKARWIGSAALSLAYVAAGRGDAYWESGIMFWDIAAGLAIVAAAGGDYFIKPKGKISFSVYASNKYLCQGKELCRQSI